MIYSGRKIGPQRKFSSEPKNILYSFSLSLSQCCFVCISWETNVFAISTQLRCDLRDGSLIDVWIRTKLSRLHQARETLCGLLLPSFPASHPAPFCLPFIFHCGAAPHCSAPVLKKIPWSQTSSAFLHHETSRRPFSPRKAGLEPPRLALPISFRHWSSI